MSESSDEDNPYLNLRPYLIDPTDFVCPSISLVWKPHYTITVGTHVGVTHAWGITCECKDFVSGAAFKGHDTYQAAVDYYAMHFRAGKCRIEPKKSRSTPSPAPSPVPSPLPAPVPSSAPPPALVPSSAPAPAPVPLSTPAPSSVPSSAPAPAPATPAPKIVYHYVSSTETTPQQATPQVTTALSVRGAPQPVRDDPKTPTPAPYGRKFKGPPSTLPAMSPAMVKAEMARIKAARDDPKTPTPAAFGRKYLGHPSTSPVVSPPMLIAEMAKSKAGSGLGVAFDNDFVLSLAPFTDNKTRAPSSLTDKARTLSSLTDNKARAPRKTRRSPSLEVLNSPDPPKKQNSDPDPSATLPLYLDGDISDDEAAIPEDDAKAKTKKAQVQDVAPATVNSKGTKGTKGKGKATAKDKTAAPVPAQPPKTVPSSDARPPHRNASPGPSTKVGATNVNDSVSLNATSEFATNPTAYKVLTPRPVVLRSFRDVGINTSPLRGHYIPPAAAYGDGKEDDDMQGDGKGDDAHSDGDSSGYGSLGFDEEEMEIVFDLVDKSV